MGQQVIQTILRFNRRRLLLCLIVGILLVLSSLLFFTISPPNHEQSPCQYIMPKRNDSSKQILILDWSYKWLKDKREEHTVQQGRCRWTNNRCILPHAHAVVFVYDQHDNDLIARPWKHYRDENQTFIFRTHESPANFMARHVDLKRLDTFFNWTMTYKRDADVVTPYGSRSQTINQLDFGTDVVEKILKRKSKLALWLVSDCADTCSARRRLQVTDELIAAGMPIDRIGKCFNNADLLPRRRDMWASDEMRSYKFYIAFENSHHCTDYMTEKLWQNAYRSGAVPIIWGPRKIDVVAVAPPNSFIHADDFNTSAELATYILHLDADDEAYRKYFQWRENAQVSVESMEAEIRAEYPDLLLSSNTEELCDVLHRRRHEKKVIPSIYDEFVARDPSECYQVPVKLFGWDVFDFGCTELSWSWTMLNSFFSKKAMSKYNWYWW